jgi:polysaccharide export outer membrane protein
MRTRRLLPVTLACLVFAACTGLNPDLKKSSRDTGPAEYAVTAITPSLVQQMRKGRAGATTKAVAGDSRWNTDARGYAYHIGPGDRLKMEVPSLATFTPLGAGPAARVSEERPANVYTVSDKGTIYLPYVGEVAVAGNTLSETQALVTKELSKFVRNPQVLVAVAEFRSQGVLVLGEVPTPGGVPIGDRPLTLLGALQAAGALSLPPSQAAYPSLAVAGPATAVPLKYADLRRVRVRRGDGEREVDVASIVIDGKLDQNLILMNGDTITVPRLDRPYIYLLGEVKTPGLVEINAQTATLAQVISFSGGLNQITAEGAGVYVIRGSFEAPQIFQLDINAADALLLADAFDLSPRDVVYVSEARISRWNRFLTQLVPTIQSLLTGGVFATQVK